MLNYVAKREAMYSLIEPIAELLRPWKLISLSIGLGLLIFGSYFYDAPDWDVPISIIMAGLTYLAAPATIRILLYRRWSLLPATLLIMWFCVDGCYWIYWTVRNPHVLPLMREVNFFASSALYGICGVIWLYRGTMHDLTISARRVLHLRSRQ